MNRLTLLRLASLDQLRVVDDFLGFYAGKPTARDWRRFGEWAAMYYAQP